MKLWIQVNLKKNCHENVYLWLMICKLCVLQFLVESDSSDWEKTNFSRFFETDSQNVVIYFNSVFSIKPLEILIIFIILRDSPSSVVNTYLVDFKSQSEYTTKSIMNDVDDQDWD